MPKTFIFPAILHGGDYNPEQWPEDVWDDDVRLMHEAHVNVATVPVFGWVSLQPDEDTFTFEWLDRVLDKLHAGGVYACLATATASVPAWLDQKYPDVLRVDSGRRQEKARQPAHVLPELPQLPAAVHGAGPADGRAIQRSSGPGSGTSPTSTAITATATSARRRSANGWQDRYGSLDEVNRRWYTAFWGHTYTDWSQIETPTHNGERSMQALLIDYDRFQSESIWTASRPRRTSCARSRRTSRSRPI